MRLIVTVVYNSAIRLISVRICDHLFTPCRLRSSRTPQLPRLLLRLLATILGCWLLRTEINRMLYFFLACSKQLINKILLPFTSNLCSLSDLCRSIRICDRSFFNFKQSHFHALLCWHIPTWTSSLD